MGGGEQTWCHGVEVMGNYLPSFPEALIRSHRIYGMAGVGGCAGRLPGHEQSLPCRCWTSNDNMAFWWILRFPVFLAILVRKQGTCWHHREG